MWAKAAFYVGGYVAIWALLCFAPLSSLAGVGLAMLLGLFGTGIALNIGHEASHELFSPHRRVNAALYWFSMNLLGTYHYLWKLGHERTHHPYVNIPGHDVGSDGGGLLRFTSKTPLKPFHRHQHLYGPALYTLYTLTWTLFRDWRVLRSGDIAAERHAHPRWRYLELGAVKLGYFGYILAVPMAFSSFRWWEVLVGFAAMHAVLSLYLAAMLFTSHLALEPAFPEPDRHGAMPHSYFRHQLVTTMDVHPESRLANFLLGGFNAHAIHHFFPKVSSQHYPELTRILRQTCAEFGLPYLSTNLPHAVASHLRFLKANGTPLPQPAAATALERA